MKKALLAIAAVLTVASASALPKAFYIKQGNNLTKYNFGVAGTLGFSNNGNTLEIPGYKEVINLNEIDFISFSAPEVTSLTPAAQKARLVDIGDRAYKMINLHDNTDAFKMIDAFFEDRYADDYSHDPYYKAPVNFRVPRAYYDVHNEFRAIMKAFRGIAQGNPAAARTLKAKALSLYKFEDYNGIYTANPATESWEKSPADHFEMRFTGPDGTPYAISLTAGTAFDTWDTSAFKSQFPHTIDFDFRAANKSIAVATLTTTMVQDRHITTNLDFTSNRYHCVNTMMVTNGSVTDSVYVTVDGKEICHAGSYIQGQNLLNYDIMKHDFEALDHAHDAAGNCLYDEYGDAKPLAAHFIRGVAAADVLGELQVSGHLFDLEQNVRSKDGLDDIHYYVYINKTATGYEKVYTCGKIIKTVGDHYDLSDYEIDNFRDRADYLNNYTDIAFFYDNKPAMQGYMAWEALEDEREQYTYHPNYSDYPTEGFTIVDDYLVAVSRDIVDYIHDGYNDPIPVYGPWYFYTYVYDANGSLLNLSNKNVDESQLVYPASYTFHYYKISPLVVFPDQTSYSASDFFDEDSFSVLVNDYHDMINTYHTIVGWDEH